MHAVVVLWLLLAQAEAAPAPPIPPPPPGAQPSAAPVLPEDPRLLSAFLGGSFRLAASDLPGPSTGFSIGGAFEYRYRRLGAPEGQPLLLGVGLSFFHDHFTQGVPEASSDRVLTQTAFVLSQTAALPLAAGVTPWLSLGAGLTIGYFSTPETALQPGSISTHQPALAAGAGLDVTIHRDAGVRLRVHFMHTLLRPDFVTDNGGHLDLFGDLLDMDVGVFYRF